ncbi:MAG: elongation factor P [Verrucomicrobia bacterium]|nr:elongation factor P [Verrucomicrobiota bacterium]
MASISTNDLRQGAKVEMDGQPYVVVGIEFVKPGKGQAFNRVKVKHLVTGRVIERTFKSGEKIEEADIQEAAMRLLYTVGEDAVFMDDKTFEQITIHKEALHAVSEWLKEDVLYDVVIYKEQPISVEPPTFMELKITQCDPGVRGDTASGKVLKPAVTESGAKVQVPIFIDEGEILKIDTRTGEYVSRVS